MANKLCISSRQPSVRVLMCNRVPSFFFFSLAAVFWSFLDQREPVASTSGQPSQWKCQSFITHHSLSSSKITCGSFVVWFSFSTRTMRRELMYCPRRASALPTEAHETSFARVTLDVGLRLGACFVEKEEVGRVGKTRYFFQF